MTYYSSYYHSYSYTKKYEWTAYTESDFLGSGTGGSISCGDTFTMPGSPTVCMSTYDNDGYLSGDDGWCNDERANDNSGQNAYIDGGRVGGQLYAECYHKLKGSDGKIYYLIEIEVEGYDAPGAGDDFFTFYGAVPPAGVTLKVIDTCNVKGCMIDYRCLGAGDKAPANTPPEFTNDPAYGKICIDENTTFVIDLNAKDKDGDALNFKIVGGADAALFTINEQTGELTFKAAPDYENAKDSNKDNIYKVEVKVLDGKGGEDLTKLSICVDDVKETTPGKCIVIEAESMCEWGFSKAWGCNASNGKLVKLDCYDKGKLWTTFDGQEGNYDFKLFAQDENDGKSKLTVYVNGSLVGTIKLDRQTDGGGSDNGKFSTFTLEDLKLKKGDVITIWAEGNCGEQVRIDKIELCLDEPKPELKDDAAGTCADTFAFVDVLDNDTNGDTLTITHVDGKAISEGNSITTDYGTIVTLVGGELKIDGEDAYAYLDIGEKAMELITYTASNGKASAQAKLEMNFCGDANSVESFADYLPSGDITYKIKASNIDFPIETYGLDVQIIDASGDRFDGVIFSKAYCLYMGQAAADSEDFATAPINVGTVTNTTDPNATDVFSAGQKSAFNGLAASDNFDLINWILNQDYEENGYTGWEVQRAIWELTNNNDTGYMDAVDPGFGSNANVETILGQAAANGEGFVAGVGDVFGLIIDPGDADPKNLQPFILAVEFETYDCLC